MSGIDDIHGALSCFASGIIDAMGPVNGFEVEIYFPVEQTEDEESAYQMDANMETWEELPHIKAEYPIKGINIRRFEADDSLDEYPLEQKTVIYLPKELELPQGVKVVVIRGHRRLSFKGDVVKGVEGEQELMYKLYSLHPMEARR